jgi:putative SOS response-associated peptidase YedK
MCGRFTSTASPEELMRHFGVTILENLQPRWNVAPGQSALVIQQSGLHAEVVYAKWGLPPASSKQSFLINARMETVTEKPTFRDAFATRRCLVAATGWYEWSAPRQPWHIQLGDGGLMAFAGLLFTRGGRPHFVVMTSAAEGELKSIHHRQPLVLPRNSWHGWLTNDGKMAEQYLQAAPTSLFNWYRVGPAVGKVAEDHPRLVTPLDEAALAAEKRGAQQASGTPGQGDLFV